MKAHPTSIVDPSALVADDVEIGPYCVVGPGVRIGPGCRLLARVVLSGPSTIGRGNVFFPNVVIGGAPQGAPAAEDGRIEIADDNLFREAATVHRPATPGGVTRIGSRNRFHAHSSVGHDCILGDGVVVGSFGGLSGHTVVGDGAWIEGSGGTGERVILGQGCRLQSHFKAESDVPPFMVFGRENAAPPAESDS